MIDVFHEPCICCCAQAMLSSIVEARKREEEEYQREAERALAKRKKFKEVLYGTSMYYTVLHQKSIVQIAVI